MHIFSNFSFAPSLSPLYLTFHHHILPSQLTSSGVNTGKFVVGAGGGFDVESPPALLLDPNENHDIFLLRFSKYPFYTLFHVKIHASKTFVTSLAKTCFSDSLVIILYPLEWNPNLFIHDILKQIKTNQSKTNVIA